MSRSKLSRILLSIGSLWGHIYIIYSLIQKKFMVPLLCATYTVGFWEYGYITDRVCGHMERVA